MKLPWDKLVGLMADGGEQFIHASYNRCGKALKMEHVMSTVTQIVYFVKAKTAHITIIQAAEAGILCGAQVSTEKVREMINMFHITTSP